MPTPYSTPNPAPMPPGQQGPGPARSKMPGWVIAVIIIAAVAVIIAVLLGGILIGRLSAGPEPAAITPAPVAATPEPAPEPETAEEAPAPDIPAAEQEAAVDGLAEIADAEDAGNASGHPVSAILNEIESRPGFDDSVFAPLCSYTDIDDDDVFEFLAVYADDSNGHGGSVCFEFWSVPTGGRLSPGMEDMRVLFDMVGGNSGTAGLAVHDGMLYLALRQSIPDGDSFHELRAYVPIHAGGLFWDDAIQLESRGTYGDEHNGYYYRDGSEITMEDYDAFVADYISPITLNILTGPGEDEVATFEVMHTWFD